MEINRRTLLKGLSLSALYGITDHTSKASAASRILHPENETLTSVLNDYSLRLPGEEDLMRIAPYVMGITDKEVTVELNDEQQTIKVNGTVDGWHLLAIIKIGDNPVAVFERHVTHGGMIVFIFKSGGVFLRCPKAIGYLPSIQPQQFQGQQTSKSAEWTNEELRKGLERQSVLSRLEDPCYENINVLRKNEVGGIVVPDFQPSQNAVIIVDPYGKSSLYSISKSVDSDCPTLSLINEYDPRSTAPEANRQSYFIPIDNYKRTLLGTWILAADIGAYNPDFHTGYETMVLMSTPETSEQLVRVRYLIPDEKLSGLTADDGLYHDSDGSAYIDYFHNTTPEVFYYTLLSTCIRYQYSDETVMEVSIPDTWLLQAARTGLNYVRRNINSYFITESPTDSETSIQNKWIENLKYYSNFAQILWNREKGYFSSFKFFMTTILNSSLHNVTIDRYQKLLLTEFISIFLSTDSESYFQPGLEYLLDKLPVLNRIVDEIILKYNQSKQSHPESSWLHGIIMEETICARSYNSHTKKTPHSIYDHAIEAWWAVSEYALSLAMISKRFKYSKLKDRTRELLLVAQEMYKSLTWSLSQSECSSCTFSNSEIGMCRYHTVVEKNDENLDQYVECSILNRAYISEHSRNQLASGVQKHENILKIL